ncbi:MAG TPA: hypothetical protein VIY08_02015 [Candidatus Nitrosocosmicus sp.]
MDLFKKKHKCDTDGEKFDTYEQLIEHARKIHHYTILKCNKCRKQFFHEKDRLHHVREEHGKEMDVRTHKNDYKRKKEGYSSIKINPQDGVDSKKM